MKKRDLGLILGTFFVLLAVYFPITAFVFNGGFSSPLGILAFSLNAVIAAIMTLIIYSLVSDKNQTEDEEEDEEEEEPEEEEPEEEKEDKTEEGKGKDQLNEEQTEKN
jgi:hypothetical protein